MQITIMHGTEVALLLR